MGTRIAVEFYGGKNSFLTDPKLFSPKQLDEGSRLLLESVTDSKAKTVLDLGCGYGAMGIIYAKLRPESFVTLLDNDPRALELARENSILNQIKNVRIFKANITYATLPWKFDLILSNPPWSKSKSVIPKLLEFTHEHLAVGGKLYLVVNKTFRLDPSMEKIFGKVTTVSDCTPYKALGCTWAKS